MKSVLRFVTLFCAMTLNLYAQPDWTVVPQDPSTIIWNAVAFTDENHGTVVGFEGHVWTTFNACAAWSKTSFGVSNSMLCVRYLNANVGYTGGQNGTLAKTTDGGLTWNTVGIGATFAINDVYFHNENDGVIVGQSGNVRLTTNGGGSWSAPTSNFGPNNVYGLAFPSSTIGYIVGNAGKISKTTNGGSTWTSQNSGTSTNLYGVAFGSVSNGAVVGTDGKILYTTNGGSSWQNASVNSPISSVVLRDIQFVDANEAYCVGWQGYVLRSTNAGKDWTVLNVPTTTSLEGLSFISKTFGYAAGWDGTIIRTKKPGELSAPILLQPLNGAVNAPMPPSLSWSPVSGALSYRVQVSEESGFTSTVIDQSGVPGSPYTASGLDNNKTYYWRVHAVGTLGAGPWSDTWSFTTTGSLPAAPRLLSPENDTLRVPLSVNLLWEGVAGAVSYGMQLATDPGFTAIVRNETGIAETLYPLTGLDRSKKYYWRVNATNAQGSGPWSVVWNFTTVGAAPDAPALLSPANNATDVPTAGTVSWSASTNAESYQLQISRSPVFTTFVIDESGVTVLSRPYAGLAVGTDYYWRVRAVNVEGAGPWSAIWKFTTAGGVPAAPVLLAPADNAVNIPPSGNLQWNAAAGAQSYHVQIALSSDFSAAVFDSSGVSGVNCPYANLQRSTRHYWRVAAVNTNGAGPWSTVWSFTTQGEILAAPALISPPDDTTDVLLQGTVRWSLVSRSLSYQVQIATSDDFAMPVMDSSGITATTANYRGLQPGIVHYWRVRGANASGPGNWSDIWSFTTIGSTLSAPVLISPADDTTGMPVDGLLLWSEVTDADSYRAQLSGNSGFTALLMDSSGITDTQVPYSGLSREARYWWRVRAENQDGGGPWSAVRSFVTESVVPEAPDLMSPANRAEDVPLSGMFRWYSTQNTTEYHLQLARTPDFSSAVIDTTGILGTQKAYSGLEKDTNFYYWRVCAVNGVLRGPWSEVWSFRTEKPPTTGDAGAPAPAAIALHTWPNPARDGDVAVEIALDAKKPLTVQILDSKGALVETLFDGEARAGVTNLSWSSGRFAVGTYFVRAQGPGINLMRKMSVVR